MTAVIAAPRESAHPAPALRTYRFELRKLLAQWRIRLTVLACWLGPALFVAVVSRQSSLPSDTVFGRWMGQTGWAGPLVVLSFCCSWALPLLTSVVAGDVSPWRTGSARGGTCSSLCDRPAGSSRPRRPPASPWCCCWWRAWRLPASPAG